MQSDCLDFMMFAVPNRPVTLLLYLSAWICDKVPELLVIFETLAFHCTVQKKHGSMGVNKSLYIMTS